MAAQVVNFVILLVLLRRFLYRPVLEAVERREAVLGERLRHAEELQEEARAAEERIRTEQAELEARRLEVLRQAEQEAERHRAELLERAHDEAEAARARWKEGLSREQEGLLQELRETTAKELYNALDRALVDLAGTSLEERMAAALVRRFDGLEPADRDALVAAMASADNRVEVRSASPLDREIAGGIIQALERALGISVQAEFEVEPALVAGVEVRVGDRKLAWSVADYLARLERATRTRLEDAGRGA